MKKELCMAKILNFVNHTKAILFYQAKFLKLMICRDENLKKPIPIRVYKKKKAYAKS
jgi:hypothetical protein